MQCNVVSIAGSSPRPQLKTSLKAGTKALLLLKSSIEQPSYCCHEDHYHSGAEGVSEATPQLSSPLPANCHKTPGLGSSTWGDFNLRLPTNFGFTSACCTVCPYSLPHLTAPCSDTLHINPALWKSGNIKQWLTLHHKTELLVNTNYVLEETIQKIRTANTIL